MKSKKHCLILATVVLIPLFSSATDIIKMGTSAPERSPWVDAMKEMSRGWERISQGKVKVKIYAGGIAGNEEDTIRKTRLGTLSGAAVSNMGVVKIYPDAYVLNAPFLFNSEEELEYVLEKMKPRFEKEIEDRGFKVIIWTMAGWVHFFTKEQALHPEDMTKFKIGFSVGEPEMEQAWKKMGYHVIPTDLKDLLIGLQSGMVNAFTLPPLIAASGQYFPLAPHMNSLKVAPLLGAVIISERGWKNIPAEYHEPMLELTRGLSDGLYEETVKLEKEAVEAMKKHGLMVYSPPSESLPLWKEAAQEGIEELVGRTFSAEIYKQVLDHLSEFRKNHGGR